MKYKYAWNRQFLKSIFGDIFVQACFGRLIASANFQVFIPYVSVYKISPCNHYYDLHAEIKR